MRSWPLPVLAAPAAAEVWSGWVGIAHETGFGLVPPLPGIWPSLHLDTAITLPVGADAYAACALRAWLASEHKISARTRRFAKWSAICSFTLGMAGQAAYHLLDQAGVTSRRTRQACVTGSAAKRRGQRLERGTERAGAQAQCRNRSRRHQHARGHACKTSLARCGFAWKRFRAANSIVILVRQMTYYAH